MATALRTSALDEAALSSLKAGFRGEVIGRDDPGYDDARRVFNDAVDRRPALVARPVDVADVQTALRFGIDLGLQIAVRGGGHHGAGFGTVDDGLVIDLGRLRVQLQERLRRLRQVGRQHQRLRDPARHRPQLRRLRQ